MAVTPERRININRDHPKLLDQTIPKSSEIKKVPYDFSSFFDGYNITLYRGTTGSETNSGLLYMTDDPVYAASYVKNGGSVVKVSLPKNTFDIMILNSDVSINKGLNIMSNDFGLYGTARTEYIFSSRVKPYIVSLFTPFSL